MNRNLERLFKENRYMMLEDSKEELVACDWFALKDCDLSTNHVHEGLKLTNRQEKSCEILFSNKQDLVTWQKAIES